MVLGLFSLARLFSGHVSVSKHRISRGASEECSKSSRARLQKQPREAEREASRNSRNSYPAFFLGRLAPASDEGRQVTRVQPELRAPRVFRCSRSCGCGCASPQLHLRLRLRGLARAPLRGALRKPLRKALRKALRESLRESLRERCGRRSILRSAVSEVSEVSVMDIFFGS